MRVLLFGPLADRAGWSELDLEMGPTPLEALRDELVRRTPELAGALDAPGVQVAVDQAIVRGAAMIPLGAEVAFLPPMSGG